MVAVSGDLKGMGKALGAIGGIISAVEDPKFKGDFVEHLKSNIKKSFYAETIARKNSGDRSLNHVFEWGENQGEVTNEPLFLLTSSGVGGKGSLGFVFLPSTKFVPLPDPARYGFDSDKVQSLRRHVFQLKALVMETRSRVTVSPTFGERLFIPWAAADKGYVFTKKSVKFNPGGPESTGGFAKWWNEWFATRAQLIANEESEKVNRWLVATGNNQVRYVAGTVIAGIKVGGQYAKGRSVTTSYINAEEKKVRARVMAESKKMFDVEKWEADPE